jgi:hypothetical protein
MALMSSRRFHRFLDELVTIGAQGVSAETFVAVTVRSALDDPVAQRVLHDEPDVIGRYLSSGSLAVLAEQVADLLTPVLAAAMGAGLLRPSDPRMAAGWIVRIVLALGAVPPPDDALEDTVRAILLPLLEPGTA